MLMPHERYLFKPFFGSSHHWALERIKLLEDLGIKRDCSVLDIGCGSGAIGRELKNRGFTRVNAIEIDEEARKNSIGVYEQIFIDLNEALNNGRTYKLILLLDIIEHLADPQNYLEQLVPLVEDGATILISVPNITHWSIRIGMLFGRFEYTDRGILDRTHLHFFTKKHLLETIGRIDEFKLNYICGSIVPLEFLLPKWLYRSKLFNFFSKIRFHAAKKFPNLFGYQLLAEVKNGQSNV
jgi:SAM-dependent methyltransferase